MINQQLLDFIKLQFSRGVDKETITKELLGSGWLEQDIKEGFNFFNVPVVNPIINPITSTDINNPILTQANNHSGKKVLLIIVALFIIAGGTSGYYFRNDIPIIKDLVKSKTPTPVDEIKNNPDLSSKIELEGTEQIQPEKNTRTSLNDDKNTVQPIKKIVNNTSVKNNQPTNSGQLSDCSKVTGEQDKFVCVLMNNRISGDYTTCDQFLGVKDERIGDYRDECYYDISQQTKNIKLCDIIVGQKTKDRCYLTNAKDESLCNIIITSSSKARCLEKFNPSKITSQLCDLIDKKENGGYEYNHCYYFVMKQNYDYNVCKKMTDIDSINSCYHDVATKKLDLKICDMINVDTGSNGRNWCIVVIGRLTNNKTLCNLITGKEEIASCEVNI